MKILVFSDSHGCTMRMIECVEEERPDRIFHLGDMVGDTVDLKSVFPEIPLHSVCGNNDWGSNAPGEEIAEEMGIRFFLTHGHNYGVRSTTDRLARAARAKGCQVALFGHTHESLLEYDDGVIIANPGSITMPYGELPSYLRITLKAGKRPKYDIVHIERTDRTTLRERYKKKMQDIRNKYRG